MSGHYPVGNLEPDIRRVGRCLASVPCKETMFDHKEHQLCNHCKRRVPVPLDTKLIANSVSSCAMCEDSYTKRWVNYFIEEDNFARGGK